MNTLGFVLFGISLLGSILTGFFYVLFGQVTVRKLRKNPITKSHLGFEYISGWDIMNVAHALAMPIRWCNTLSQGPLTSFYANAELLRQNTTKVDRTLAIIFCTFFYMTGLSILPWLLLDVFGQL